MNDDEVEKEFDRRLDWIKKHRPEIYGRVILDLNDAAEAAKKIRSINKSLLSPRIMIELFDTIVSEVSIPDLESGG